jgi:acyl carrier protein
MTPDRRLLSVFQGVFGRDVSSRLSDDDSPATIRGWDSMNHVHLLLALEAEFNVQFEADEFANLVSVGAIRRRLNLRESAQAGDVRLLTPAEGTCGAD